MPPRGDDGMMDKRFVAFNSLLGEDETVVWAGASSVGRSFLWIRWLFLLGVLAMLAGMGIEPIPSIASWVTHAVFNGFGVGIDEMDTGRVFGLEMATVLIRLALAGWGAITLFGCACILLEHGNEIHVVTDRRVLSLSGSQASTARLTEIGRIICEVVAGKGSITLKFAAREDFHLIGLDDHVGAYAAISRGIALTKGVIVEVGTAPDEAAGDGEGGRGEA